MQKQETKGKDPSPGQFRETGEGSCHSAQPGASCTRPIGGRSTQVHQEELLQGSEILQR